MVYITISKKLNDYLRKQSLTEEKAVAILTSIREEMIKNFGRTDLQLGDIQKLVRGDKAIPLPGLPDVLAAMNSAVYKNGMVQGRSGDAYI